MTELTQSERDAYTGLMASTNEDWATIPEEAKAKMLADIEKMKTGYNICIRNSEANAHWIELLSKRFSDDF